MKFLIFSPYYPPHTGGLESHSHEFNLALVQSGATATVFTPRLPETSATEDSDVSGLTIVRYPAFDIVPNYPFPAFWRLDFWTSVRRINQEDYDIVISRTRFFLSSFFALVYAVIQQKPLIHIEHGSEFVRLSSPWKTAIARLYDETLGRLVLSQSKLNIAISNTVASFVRQFNTRPTPVIYRGIDFDAIDIIPENKSIRERFPEKIIIATAARLYQWKGIESSIEAIRLLPENLKSKITFFIIGEGEDFQHLQDLSRDLPIEMTGRLSREETIAILKTSDIYIHSSHPGGGLSTSLIEAMYCDTAVIATPNEGADEVVIHEKNGILIGNGSVPAEISNAITRLIRNESERIAFSKAAQEDVRKKFSWDISISRYLDIFEKTQE